MSHDLSRAQLIEALEAAQRALRESEERYQALYTYAPVMLHSIDRTGRLISVSDRWLEVLGYERAEVLGRRSTEFLTPESQRYAREVILPDYFRTGRCSDVPYQFVTKSGELRDVLLSAIAERDEDDLHLRSFAVVIDVTERKRIEREFHEAQKLESLGVLASGIAHDFNNLLVGMYGFMDLALLDLTPGSRAHGYVGEAKKAAQHAADLIAQLLAYAGKSQTRWAPVDINELLEEMANLLRTSVSKKTRLRFDLGAGVPPTRGDATQLRQIVLNLVTNADQALGDVPGEVTVSTMKHESCDLLDDAQATPKPCISLRVHDTGPGLDDETRDKIFDPFFTTKVSGSGLGLAAVHGIVRTHGGTIRVESAPGRGTQFTVCLPLRAAPEVGPIPAPDTPPAWKGSGTILLVDDEPWVLKVARAMLEELGFAVVTASNGAEALDVFRRDPKGVRCALVDYKMPLMDGEETCRALLELRPDLPVILSSGYTESQTTDRVADRGLAGFIQKPYALAALRQTLCAALKEGTGA